MKKKTTGNFVYYAVDLRTDMFLPQAAPPGLSEVITLNCGTCSNENAFKAAFIDYMVCKSNLQ